MGRCSQRRYQTAQLRNFGRQCISSFFRIVMMLITMMNAGRHINNDLSHPPRINDLTPPHNYTPNATNRLPLPTLLDLSTPPHDSTSADRDQFEQGVEHGDGTTTEEAIYEIEHAGGQYGLWKGVAGGEYCEALWRVLGGGCEVILGWNRCLRKGCSRGFATCWVQYLVVSMRWSGGWGKEGRTLIMLHCICFVFLREECGVIFSECSSFSSVSARMGRTAAGKAPGES